MITAVLMHQGVGLGAFNGLPIRRAVHALYECVNTVMMAADLAKERPYADHAALFRRAEALLVSLSEDSIDNIMAGAAARCADKFGIELVMHAGTTGTECSAPAVITAIGDRMHPDTETEREVIRNEVAKLNRSRLERMLGPEGGYDNWI
jgi:hypothetical protein